MWNSSWAIVVVIALVIVALFGYWAIQGDFGGRSDTAQIETDVNVNRAPAERTESRSETRIEAEVDTDRQTSERTDSRMELRPGGGSLEVERESSQ